MRLNGIPVFTIHDMEAVEKVIGYIDNNFCRQFSADELSLDFQIPVKKLQKGMQRKMGLSVHKYQLKVRIDNAKLLLSDTDEPIKKISKKLGFSSPSHFGDAFKENTGMPPVEWRNHHRTKCNFLFPVNENNVSNFFIN
jgi:AraC-like DNA-binding protein